MVRTVKYKLITPGCAPVINDNGNAFDLVAAKDVTLQCPKIAEDQKVKFDTAIIPLGIAMELPKGCIANVRPRSSTYKKWHVLQTNSVRLIDESYCGDTDEWRMQVLAFAGVHIHQRDRLCQFEIRPSQTATLWQKLMWLFTTKYNFVQVDSLGHEARGGFGEGTKNVDGK